MPPRSDSAPARQPQRGDNHRPGRTRRPDERDLRKRVFHKRLRAVLAAGAVAAAGLGLALLKGKKPRS